MIKKLFFVFIALVPAMAQTALPEFKPMQIVKVFLPYTAGTGPDKIFRILESYGIKKGITFVPEYRPGGDGNIGVSAYLREPANGNSILLTTISDISKESSYKTFIESDLYPVTAIANTPVFIVARNDLKIKNLSELRDTVIKDPTLLTWGVISKSFEEHIHNFISLSGASTKLTVITRFNTKGGVNSATSLAGGHIDLSVMGATVAASLIKQGKIKLLGTVRPYKNNRHLDTNTEIESFDTLFGKYDSINGFGIFVNSKTSVPARNYWDKFFKEFKDDREVRALFERELFVLFDDLDKKDINHILKINRNSNIYKISSLDLTPRQKEIVKIIATNGSSNKQIARTLGIGESAVKLHVGSVLKKYGLRDRTHLSVFFNKVE